MRGLAIGTATFGILALATLGLAGTAAAAPTGGSNAADAVNQLQAQGYTVQINGDQNAPLSACVTTQVSGLSGTNSAGKPLTPAQVGTVYVTVSCDDNHDE
ncbi:hypothetical protein [Mycobacterium sp.]|uniref:hypothetical protein n=1 Tax=Mycobacterium sp. TaxID=1785 RepID=UPI002C607641|nr:hypothetical protein [Mycobacterium sp.]HKP43164.1 hypothetical protein [Mycobacterium sp.]